MNDFWSIVVSNAVVASVLAVVAGLVGRVWRNPAAIHLLWVVVLLKLGTPPLVIAPLPRADSIAPQVETDNAPDFRKPGSIEPSLASNPPSDATARPPQPSRLVPNPVIAPARPWSLGTLLGTLWLAGSGGMIWIQARRIHRFAVGLRDAEPASPELRARVAELAGRLGFDRVPEVALTPHAWPPLVWSMGFAPRLVLPAALFDRLSEPAQTTILAHELIHIRRGDHLVRLLELASLTVFWWHPGVWVACRRLRDLEETCCDGRVVELLPDQPRAYATALLTTLEFLAGRLGPPVPLRTAILSSPSLSRRITMLTRPRPNRLNVRTAGLVATLAAVPLALAFAQAPEPAPKFPPVREVQPPTDAPVTVVQGRITDMKDVPLADVRLSIEVHIGQSDPNRAVGEHPKLATRSDPNGNYRVEIPGITQRSTMAVVGTKPGYRGNSITVGPDRKIHYVEIEPGKTTEVPLKLYFMSYFRGIVVNEQGEPIPAVSIFGELIAAHSQRGMDSAETNADGRFELFNYPAEPFLLRKPSDDKLEAAQGNISLTHPDYIDQKYEDLASIAPDQRDSIRIVLRHGHKITGRVVDTAGKPVSQALVETRTTGAQPKDGLVATNRKATLTDANGQFTLCGLTERPTTLLACSLAIKQKAKLPLTLNADQTGLEIRLEPLTLPTNLKTYDVLGMKLADVTPEFRSAYNLRDNPGALILDPGPNSDRLQIGTLAEGYSFWVVGQTRVVSVHAFVDQLLTESAAFKPGEDLSVRVAYNFSNPEFEGSDTEYLKLTPDDRQQLQVLAEQMKAEKP